MNIYIIGAGTLGRFILDILDSQKEIKVKGFFDDNFPEIKSICNIPILGRITDINSKLHSHIAIGIGEPSIRKRFHEYYIKEGFKTPSIIHRNSVISKNSIVEDGVIIGPYSTILNGSIVKKVTCILSHVNINQDVIIEPFCLIGAGVTIGNNVVLGEGCHIGMSNHVKLKQTIEPWTYYNMFG